MSKFKVGDVINYTSPNAFRKGERTIVRIGPRQRACDDNLFYFYEKSGPNDGDRVKNVDQFCVYGAVLVKPATTTTPTPTDNKENTMHTTTIEIPQADIVVPVAVGDVFQYVVGRVATPATYVVTEVAQDGHFSCSNAGSGCYNTTADFRAYDRLKAGETRFPQPPKTETVEHKFAVGDVVVSDWSSAATYEIEAIKIDPTYGPTYKVVGSTCIGNRISEWDRRMTLVPKRPNVKHVVEVEFDTMGTRRFALSDAIRTLDGLVSLTIDGSQY